MKLISNISQAGITVNISVIKTDRQHMSFELNHGDSVLVDNTGIETKSIIIQQKKGNIKISDEYSKKMTPYLKYALNMVDNNEIDETFVKAEQQSEVSPFDMFSDDDEIEIVPDLLEEVTTESENIVLDAQANIDTSEKVIEHPITKGGRPKGSNRKPFTKAQIARRRREQYKLKKKNKNKLD